MAPHSLLIVDDLRMCCSPSRSTGVSGDARATSWTPSPCRGLLTSNSTRRCRGKRPCRLFSTEHGDEQEGKGRRARPPHDPIHQETRQGHRRHHDGRRRRPGLANELLAPEYQEAKARESARPEERGQQDGRSRGYGYTTTQLTGDAPSGADALKPAREQGEEELHGLIVPQGLGDGLPPSGHAVVAHDEGRQGTRVVA